MFRGNLKIMFKTMEPKVNAMRSKNTIRNLVFLTPIADTVDSKLLFSLSPTRSSAVIPGKK